MSKSSKARPADTPILSASCLSPSRALPPLPDDHVAFGDVIGTRLAVLHEVAAAFPRRAPAAHRAGLERFVDEQRAWLDDYGLFVALKARFDGRSECPLTEDTIEMVGWNMYMTPEQASRGLVLFEALRHKELPDLPVKDQGYPDLSTIEVYR